MTEAALANRLRQIKIPIPAVPTGVEGAVGDYLRNLRRAVEANLNALFATDSIEGTRVVDETITVNQLATNSVTAAKIVANTITSNQIAADTIVGSRLIAGAITAREVATDAITAIKIKAGEVTTGKLSSVLTYTGTLTVGSATASGVITLIAAPTYGDTKIQCVKTDFTTTGSGFILGIDDSDSDLAKFYLGNTTEYLTFDGANISIACTGGVIGSATNYFNISTGKLKSSVDATSYIEIASGIFTLTSTAGSILISALTGGIDLVQLASGGEILHTSYTTTTAASSHIYFQKSASETEVFAATGDGEELGEIRFEGVNSGETAFVVGAQIVVEQVGVAGASRVTGKMEFHTWKSDSTEYAFYWSEGVLDVNNNTLNKFKVGDGAADVEGSMKYDYTAHTLHIRDNVGWKTVTVS